jgi:acetyl-CoA carboxylase biotin carboxyl carrier protein
MIDIRRLKELVKLMVENDLSEIDLRDQQETVTVKRGATGQPVFFDPSQAAAMAAAHGAAAAASGQSTAAPAAPTDYASPNPDADAYITAGASVSNGSVVCIIEAMKVFNEIKSEVDGTVERVLVQNGDSVEFGQKLFLVRPS